MGSKLIISSIGDNKATYCYPSYTCYHSKI